MNYKNCTIQDLISASQKYDMDAFEEIINRYQSIALKFSVFLCGSLEVAEAIVKECFIDLFAEISLYNTYRPIESWLLEAISQKCKDSKSIINSEPIMPSLAQELITFIQLLKSVSHEQKEALIAIKILNLQPEQASEFLNIPTETLLSRFNDGMQQLIDDNQSNRGKIKN